MSKPRFLSLKIASGSEISLSPDEAHHAFHVLRLEEGAGIVLIDGQGWSAEAEISEASKKRVVVRVGKEEIAAPRKKVTLALGLTKATALEISLKKCTEIGTYAFQPLITDHSVPMRDWNSERWNKIIHESCKQCQDPYFPILYSPLSLTTWLSQRPADHSLVFCDEAQRKTDAAFLSRSGVDVLVGPEGGWSEKERSLILEKGGVPWGLGANRLRAETASLVALTVIKQGLGEL